MKIAVIMSVCGHQKYFDYAYYSISSFIKNCPDEKMFILTDDYEKLKKYESENIIIYNFPELLNKYHDKIYNILSKSNKGDCLEYFDYNHIHHYVSVLLPIMHFELRETDFQYILKIDCDSYFAGGNFLDITRYYICPEHSHDLYMVKRDNPLMELYYDYKVGVGFTMWRSAGSFIDKYIDNFSGVEQNTIWDVMKIINLKIIEDPRLHFVMPFDIENKKCKMKCNKEELIKYLPAYFHVHDIANMEKFKEWFPF